MSGNTATIAGRNVAVEHRAGSVIQTRPLDGSPAEFDYDGYLIPGLRDAHFHPVMYAAALSVPSLKTAADFTDIGRRLQAAPAGTGPITALRLDDESLAERRLPSRLELDRFVPDRPVLIHRYCGHIAVANSRALSLAGIDGHTSNPPGGSIDRDSDGLPTGVLRETAIELVSTVLADSAKPAVARDEFLAAMGGLASLGLTSIGAMVATGEGPWADMGDQLEVVLDAADGLAIKLRLLVISQDPEHLRSSVERIHHSGGERATWLGVKIFADGSLGGHTAYMGEPFADRDTVGLSRLDPAVDLPLAQAALDLGGMVAVHAIGDRAIAQVLDFFQTLIESGAKPSQLRLEHASVLRPTDIDRLATLGAIASVQPAFLASEVGWLETRVGPERLPLTYPFRSMAEAGVVLAGGSDCPVEPPHPLLGIAVARDRCGIVPAEGLPASSALDLFTSGAARALNEPEPLTPGAPADFTIIDVDPLTATPDEIRQASVIATFVDGHPVDFSSVGPVWPG